jgi:KTSC domain
VAVRDLLGRFTSLDWTPAADVDQGTVWTAVASSNVGAVGYNAATRTMSVTFLNGSTYDYFDVDEETYDAMVNAASVGRFLHYFVKGVYAYERVS